MTRKKAGKTAVEEPKKLTEEQMLAQEFNMLMGLDLEIPEAEASEAVLDVISDEEETKPKEEGAPSETEVPEGPEGDEPPAEGEEPAEPEEEKPFEERLQSFEEKYVPKAGQQGEKSLRDQLKDFEASIQQQEAQLTSKHFLSDFPTGGIFEQGGKSIYELNSNELNDYLITLKDEGKEFAAGRVQTEYMKAISAAKTYKTSLDQLATSRGQLKDANDYVEWVEIKDELSKELKELTQQDYDAVGQWIDNKATSDAGFKAAINDKAGKLSKAVEALQSLGILKRLKEKLPTQDTTTPSAPDARSGSKKVKSSGTPGKKSYKESEIANMPQAEFNKLYDSLTTEEQDALLKGELTIPD